MTKLYFSQVTIALSLDESPGERSGEEPTDHPPRDGSDRHRPRPRLHLLPQSPQGNQERTWAV